MGGSADRQPLTTLTPSEAPSSDGNERRDTSETVHSAFLPGTHRQSKVADCCKLYFQYNGEGREKEERELEEILTSGFHFRGATEPLDLKSGLT